MSAPRVSVILPTYNRAHIILPSIRSVLDQTFSDFELIVVDDASTDNTAEVIAEIEDDRIRYVQRETNGGSAAARNSGLAAARADLIGFQDSDDLWLPHKLAHQVSTFEKLGEDIGVMYGAKILYGRDSKYNFGPGLVAYMPPIESRMRPNEDQLGKILWGNRLSVQNALFRADLLSTRDWFDPSLRVNVDWDLAIRLAGVTRFHEMEEPVVVAFIMQDSISGDRKRAVWAKVKILRKNRDAFLNHKRAFSFHLGLIGSELVDMGKIDTGRRLMRRAAALNPCGLRNYARLLLSYLPRAGNVLRRLFGAPVRRRAHAGEKAKSA